MVVNKVLNVDNRPIPALQRWLTSDGRYDTIYFIELVVEKAIEHMDCQEENEVFDKENIIKTLLASVQGIDNLTATYKLDNVFVSKIDILKEKIQKKCS